MRTHHANTNGKPTYTRRANLADNTRKAFASDLRHFKINGGTIPADAPTVTRYLNECAGFYAHATLKRRVASIRQAHVERGLPDPTAAPSIKELMRRARRQYGGDQHQAKPIRRRDLRKMLKAFGTAPLDLRDKALLLLGAAGALRRSELVNLDVDDFRRTGGGLLVRVRRSNSSCGPSQSIIAIACQSSSLCAVAALEQWLRIARIREGPIFQRISRAGIATGHRLDGASVSLVLKARLTDVGICADDYSANSLRTGRAKDASHARIVR